MQAPPSDSLAPDVLAELPLGVFVFRPDVPGDVGSFRLVYANAAAGRLLGISNTDAFLNVPLREANPAALEDPNYHRMMEVVLRGEPASLGRVEVDNPDLGAHGVFRAEAFPLPDRSVGVVFEDVGEQVRMEERLAAGGREYRALAEATLEGVALVRDGRILLVNDALCALVERPAEDLVGRAPEAVLGLDLDVGDPSMPSVLEGTLARADGRRVPVEVRVRSMPFEGAPARALLVRDVSERQAVMQALEREALRFRAIFDSTFQLIGLLRPDGTLLEANRTALEFGGLGPEDVIGKPFWECYWWSHSERVQRRLREAVARAASGEFVRYNERVRGRDGLFAVIDFSLKPVFDGGEVVLLIPEGRDITETIRSQRALRRLQRRTARILDAAGEGIVGIGADGRVTFANEAAATLLGVPAAELVGRPHAEVLRHAGDAEGTSDGLPVDRVLERGRTRRVWNVRLVRADGSSFPVEYVVSPLRDAEEGGAVVVFRDVSERLASEAALRESEERYRTLVAALHEGVVLQGADGAILASNPAAERILGLSAEQMAGRTSLDPRWRVITPDGRPLPGEQHPAMVALRTGQDVHHFVQGIHQPSGELRWILVNSSLIWDEDRTAPEAVVSTFFDITEQREAEEALRQSELRLRTILSTLSEAVLLADADGTLLAANPAARTLLGLSEDDHPNLVAGRPDSRWTVVDEHGDPFPLEEMPIPKVVRTGEPVRGVVQGLRREDGSYLWISVNAQPVFDGAGERPRAVVVSMVDISERRRAELALREREAQLQAAQQIAHVGSWHWDLETGAITWTTELYRIFGRDPEGPPPTLESYYAQVHPDDREAVRRTLAEAIEAGRAYELEHRLIRPDGTVRYLRALGEPIQRAGELPTAYQGTAQDVTEQVRAREALQRYARELEERNAELEQFAYVASHDLQEPLRMVTSFLQLLQRRYAGRLDDTADEYIAYAVDGAKRMQRLIQDLLAFSRVGTRGKSFQRVDTRSLAEEVVTDLGPAIAEHGGRVELGELPVVTADPTQMRQLLQNLVGNAIKFRGSDPPEVRVWACREGGHWLFSVADNGIGIAPEHQERIFQIFQRLHTREEYEGTGIGLAICRKIVERHGGEIWVDSEPGRGATFHFTIPVQPPGTDDPAR